MGARKSCAAACTLDVVPCECGGVSHCLIPLPSRDLELVLQMRPFSMNFLSRLLLLPLLLPLPFKNQCKPHFR